MYAFRSTDPDGDQPSPTGKCRHLLVVQVLCGRSKAETSVWSDEQRNKGRLALGSGFVPVKAGPFMPHFGFPGPDDSCIHVVYQ